MEASPDQVLKVSMLIQEETTNMEEKGLRAEESISLSHGLIRTTKVVLSVEMKGTGK